MMVLSVILLMLMFLVVFLIWDENWGTSPFVLLWSVVIILFFIVLILGIYFGGRVKLRNEKKVLRENLDRIKHSNSE